MKKVQIVGVAILIVTLLVAGAGMIFGPFLDWVVRSDHIIMLCALIVVIFCTIRIRKESR